MAWKDLHRVGMVAALVGVFFIGSALGQNLVPNPSFEDADPCPGVNGSLGWTSNWFTVGQDNTPDYYNSCSSLPGGWVPSNVTGFQYANSGDAYIGIYAFGLLVPNQAREAITVALKSTLIENRKYVFAMRYNLADIMEYSVQTLGVLLSAEPLDENTPIIDYTPTFYNNGLVFNDTMSWRLMTDTITAVGNEQYLTIANFFPDSLSDTVNLGPGDPMWDSRNAYYYIDDVSIIPLDSLLSVDDHAGEPDRALSLYPNPNQGTFTVQVPLAATQEATMEVYSISGQLVHTERLYVGSNQLQLNAANGLYLYRVMVNREPKWLGKISIGSE